MIALVGGAISQEIVDLFKDSFTIIEPGVGYGGICRDTFTCFESYAWMHDRYGAHYIGDGRAFDTVIPNAVDPDEWYTAPSKGYALFVGRLISRKGPNVAAQIANSAGLKLILAGAGVKEKSNGSIVATDGTIISGDVEHVGAVTGEDRKKLFAEAEVLICPTLYIGPWEGVHAESMMSGVGVVAPDYGVFTETLPKPYRYRNMSQALSAVDLARKTRGEMWRKRAIDLCGIEQCASMYNEWFNRLDSLRDGRNGWYS
jgi:glycosyltransferase involved in cell wall biosynthesis